MSVLVDVADNTMGKIKNSDVEHFIEFLDTVTGETKIRMIFKSEYKKA